MSLLPGSQGVFRSDDRRQAPRWRHDLYIVGTVFMHDLQIDSWCGMQLCPTLGHPPIPRKTAYMAGGRDSSIEAAVAASKISKYQDFSSTHLFVPVAIETLGPICEQGIDFLTEAGRRISARSGDPRETSFLFQIISVAIQVSAI